jgi:hypothetical protein
LTDPDALRPNTGAGEVGSEIVHASVTDNVAQARSTDSEAQRRETLDRMLRWYIATASQACRVLSPGHEFAVDVQPPDGPEPVVFDDAAAAFEWFDTERANLVANARAALEVGLAQRVWELAMVLSPIHAHHFTFDDWSVLSEIAVTAAEGISDPAALAAALDNRGTIPVPAQGAG